MVNLKILFLVFFTVIVLDSIVIYYVNSSNSLDIYKPGIWSEADKAVNQAKYFYQVEKERGMDFSQGPCLSNAVQPGWVADIVHSPRQSVDDLAQNQCAAFAEGKLMHFVELDLDGNVIRVR